MKYECFDELPVWQASAELAAKMFVWTEQSSIRGKGELASQLQLQSLSISNNIARGFESETTEELLTSLSDARAVAGQVRSMLSVMERINSFSDLTTEIAELKNSCQSISAQISDWVSSLKDTAAESHPYLSERWRAKFEYRKRLERDDGQQRDWTSEFETRLTTTSTMREAMEDETPPEQLVDQIIDPPADTSKTDT